MSRITHQEAAIPEPWQMLGLRLKPFCLGHYLHLARFKVAFVSSGPENLTPQATLTDVVMTSLVCSMTFEEFGEFIQDRNWRKEVEAWGALVGIDFDLAEKAALLNEYIAEASRQPAVVFEPDGNVSGAHWSQVLKVALLNIGYSKTEAMNLPLAEAFADFYRVAEQNGVVTIAEPELAEALDAELPGQNTDAAEVDP
jgi:hypothetical protein